jgi:ribosomal protein S18 acetylase RimI-like enzyme
MCPAIFQSIKNCISTRHEAFLLKNNLNAELKYGFKERLKIESIKDLSPDVYKGFINESGIERKHINELKKNLQSKCNGYVASLDGEMIGYVWWRARKTNINLKDLDYQLINDTVKLDVDDVYVFDYYIAKKYRGQSNAIEFLLKVFMALKAYGYNRTYGIVAANNTSARWLYSIMGYETIGKITAKKYLSSFIVRKEQVYGDKTNFRIVFPF